MSEFFIIVNHPDGELLPIIKQTWKPKGLVAEIMTFPTMGKAKAVATDDSMCQTLGYEIFDRGTGWTK